MSSAPPGLPLVLHTRVVRGSGGGPDKTILNSARFLGDDYAMVCAFLRHPDDPGFGELEALARRWRAPLAAVDDFGPLDWRLSGRLRALCRERRPAIWHGHDYKSNLLGLRLRRACPMRLVTTVHGWVKRTWRTPLYYWIDRRCLPRYDRVLCVSRDLRESCLALGVAADRCLLVPNGVDTGEYRRSLEPPEARARLGRDPGRPVIGAVGRLSPEKGLDRLVRAFAALRARGVDAELWIAGDGDQRQPLAGLVAALGVQDRVRLLGYRRDTLELLQAMEVFALASLREGLPNSLLEAMAVGLAVVATGVAGVPDLVRDGGNGLLVTPGSATELTDALGRLLGDPGLRRRLGEAARETVEESWSMKSRMRRVREIYDGVLAGKE